jgi:hypothetical protein
MKRKDEGAGPEEGSPPPAFEGGRADLQRILGRRDPMPFEEERAFSEMLDGFHRLLRYFHDTYSQSQRRPSASAGPSDPPDSEKDDDADT